MDDIPDGADVEQVATIVFSYWSSDKILNIFSNRFDKLSQLCYKFFKIIFDGIKPGMKSIYLTNKEMKDTLLGYPEWSPFIPVSTVGLHHKFKSDTGCLYHMLHAIEVLKSDEEGMQRLNDKINQNTPYSDLEDMLDHGMYMFSLHRICFLFLFSFFLKLTIICCNTIAL